MRAAPKLAGIPFVLLADEVTAELCSEAMKAGAKAVLPKSFDGDHLVATVDRLIEEAKR
jgi:DNA-binding NarL/FixJ family response regulator